MINILILYNPYYQADVIKEHLKLLIENGEVAFGKIKSKLKDYKHPFEEKLVELLKDTNEDNYIQLFLTDYSSIYVAKVTKVTLDDLSDKAPIYYKKLDVEAWFLIEDMYEIVRDDFKKIRDYILPNFITPNYDNHTYALYGNKYVYPLLIEQKNEIDYFFDIDDKLYKNVYKTDEYLNIKKTLENFVFDKYIHSLHPTSVDNIISAEIEYQQNMDNPLYDFSSVIIKYSKTMEKEIYLFLKSLFKGIIHQIYDISYEVQGRRYTMIDFFNNKPNLGTMKFLLKNRKIIEAINQKYNRGMLLTFIFKSIPYYIGEIQVLRNENVHGESATLSEAKELRRMILGVGKNSMLVELLRYKSKL